MKYLLLLVLAVAGASYAAEKSLRDPRFERGKLYKYNVEFNVTAGVLGLSSQVSAAVLRADAYIFAKTEQDLILKVENVMTSGSVKAIESKSGDIPMTPNRELEQKLSLPITFTMQNGMIKSYSLSRDESLESKKIKKAILRSLQMYIPESAHQELESHKKFYYPVTYNITKHTENGTHITQYMITSSPLVEFPYERMVYNISRFDNFEGEKYPSYKLHHNFQQQGCAEVCRKEWDANTHGAGCPPGQEPHQGPVKTYLNHQQNLSPIGKVLSFDTILASDLHYAKLYDQQMELRFRYQLTWTQVTAGSIPPPTGLIPQTEDLFDWDAEINEKEIEDLCGYEPSGDYVKIARKIVTEIGRLIAIGELESRESTLLGEKVILLRDLFHKFSFDQFQSLSRNFIKKKVALHSATDEEKIAKQVWLSILPVVGTTESIKFIAEYVKDYDNLLKWEIKDIIESIPQNIERPSEEHIKLLREISRRVGKENHYLHSASYIALGQVIGRVCRNTPVDRDQPNKPWSSLWYAGSQQSSSSSVKCPEGLVHEIVEEITRSLKNTHKPEEMVVYIGTLSRIGTFEIFEALKEYIYATAENLQDSSQRFIAFIKTMALYSLQNVVDKYPEEVVNTVYPVYFNETEAPKVRNAAFSVMMSSQPSLAVLEKVATRSWHEKSLEVGSFVTSTFESLGNSSLPCMQLTARRIKQVFPHVKRFDVGMQHAKNHYFTYFDDHREFGFEQRTEFVPSNETIVPTIFYNSFSYSMHSLKEVIAQYSFTGEGLTQEDIMEILNIPPVPKIEKEGEVFGYVGNGQDIIKPRVPEGPRYTLFSKLFYQSSYLYLDSKNYRRILEDAAEVFTQYTKTGDQGYLVRVMIPSSYSTVAVSKILPYPVEFHMSQPLVLAVGMKRLPSPMVLPPVYHWDVKPRLYMSKLYTHQVKNLGDCKEIGVYHEQKLAASFPFQITYQAQNFPNVTIKYKIRANERKALVYFSESGTYAAKKALEMRPSTAAREPIRTRPLPFQFEKTLKVVGLPPLHVQLNSEDTNIFREKLPRNSAEAFDIVARKMLNAGWRHMSMNITVLEDRSVWSPKTEATFNFRYHLQHVATLLSPKPYDHQPVEDSRSKQWSSSYQPQTYQPNRQQSSRSEDADWIKYFENIEKEDISAETKGTPDWLITAGRGIARRLASRYPHMKHVLDINLETAPERSNAYFRMEYNHTYTGHLHSVHAKAAAQLARKNKHGMSFDHVMTFYSKLDEFMYDSGYGRQAAHFLSGVSWTLAEDVCPWEGVQIGAFGRLDYANNRHVLEGELPDGVDDKHFLPEHHDECLRHVRGGHALSEECVKAIREYSIYNILSMNIYFPDELPRSTKQLLRTADLHLKYALFEHLNLTLEENSEMPKNRINIQMDYIDKFVDEPVVDIAIKKTSETLRFKRVPTKGILPLSSVYNQLESYFLETTNNTYLPSCTVMENYVRTFDLKDYPFSPRDCFYVLATHCTKRKNFAVILHGKQDIYIHVGPHTLILAPRKSNSEQYIVKFNGQQHKMQDALLLDAENEIYAYVETYNSNHEHITVIAGRAGLKVTYEDGKNIKVMVHPGYKGEMCGLCSEFDGEHLREFRGIDRCLYRDYLDFANNNLVKRSRECQPGEPRGPKMCDGGKKDLRQRGSTDPEETHGEGPWRCGDNEIFNRCGSMCPPTCDEPNPACPKGCQRGCFCKPGFIRQYKDGPCIPETQCPQNTEPTSLRNVVVKKGSEICFSVNPVPSCEGGAAETEPETLGFHCLPKRDVTARMLEEEAKWRPLEELQRKSVDLEETVDVAKLC